MEKVIVLKNNNPDEIDSDVMLGCKIDQNTIDNIKLMDENNKQFAQLPFSAQLPKDIQGDCEKTADLLKQIKQSINTLQIDRYTDEYLDQRINQIKQEDQILTKQLQEKMEEAKQLQQKLVELQDQKLEEYYQ